MTSFIENPIKIYLKDSDKVRLADRRVRIVRESDPREPCDNEDLVFEKAEDESLIPSSSLFKWNIEMADGRQWFFTTAKRCRRMVADDPSYWTFEKLQEFARIEKKLYEDWINDNVYGYIIEKWDEKQRQWIAVSSLWGMYGAEALFYNLLDATDGVSIPVCIDNEDMKYDFKNVEMKPNQFK